MVYMVLVTKLQLCRPLCLFLSTLLMAGVSLASPANPMAAGSDACISPRSLTAPGTREHAPSDFFVMAASCLDQAKMPQALVFYHVGLMRMTLLAALDPLVRDDRSGSSGVSQIGKLAGYQAALEAPLVQWASADIPQWVEALSQARWIDEQMPFERGQLTAASRGIAQQQWQDLRRQQSINLSALVTHLLGTRAQVYLARQERGLEIRDPWWSDEIAAQARAKRASESGLPDGHEDHGHNHADEPSGPRENAAKAVGQGSR